MKKLCIYGVLFLLLAAAQTASAQTVQGAVTGSVLDTSGAVLPGATVTLTNEGTNISQTLVSGPAGEYRFSLVPPGTYSLSVKSKNFREWLVKGIVVSPSQTVSMNVTLEVGATTQTVEVTTTPPLLQTASSDLTHTVSNNTIMAMPLVTRSIYDLTFMAPQVSQGMDFNPASGGTRESGTAYLLNGSDNNDNFSEGNANITPPIESVGEFSLLTNSMSAQYGRGGGVVVSAVQKSGTNGFHGALYEFNRNRSLNASGFFDNRNGNPKPKYIRNQFGGEIDGPIIKNKTFFSFAYDQVARHTGGDTTTQVPTPAELTAMATGAGPIAQSYLSKYPAITSNVLCPNEEGTAAVGHIGCTHFFDPIEDPIRTYFGRVDHNFSDKDRVSFTANISRERYTDAYGGGYPSSKPIDYVDLEHYHNLTLVETHTFGPTVVNELTIAQNRHYSAVLEGEGKNLDPHIYIDGAAYSGFGFDFGPYEGQIIENFTQDRWQLQDNVTALVGRHSIRFGGGWQHGILYRNWDLGLPGYYEFANTVGVTPQSQGVLNPDGSISGISDYSVTNFQNDFPYYQELSIDPHTGAKGNAYRHYSMNDLYLFAQDDFKVTPHLTLNLGLRWDQYGAPTEQHGILAQLTNFGCVSSTSISYFDCVKNARTGPAKSMWNTRHGDFGPRVGFAWDIFGDGRTSLRGGYGISYDRIFDNVWSNGAWNPPFYGLANWDASASDSIFYSNPPKPSPSYVPDSLPGAAGRVSIRTMENNLKDSSTQNFYLGAERQFGSNFLLRVNYQGSLGRHLPVLMNWNRYDGMGLNSKLTIVRPNSLYSGFNYRANNVTSSYHALVTEVQKRLGNGLQFQFGYTWSHLMDYGSDLFSGSTSQGSFSQPYYFISNAHKNLEKGTGAFDHKHTLKLGMSYEIPFLKDQRGFVGKVAGGWQLTGFYQAYSGHPIEVYNARARFAGRNAAGSRVLDANGNAINIGGDYNLDNVLVDHPVFLGSGNVYSNGSPADGVFTDNNVIGCGQQGIDPTIANVAACNANFGVVTPNTLFTNPGGEGVRFGGLGRNVFRGPWYYEVDAGLFKNFRLSERWKLQARLEGINLPNHPDFDYIQTNLNSANFGKAQPSGTFGTANSPRRIQIGLRLLF